MTQPAPFKRIAMLLSLVVLAVVLVLVFAGYLKPTQELAGTSVDDEPVPTTNTHNTKITGTVAAIWQWQAPEDALAEPGEPTTADAIPFSADALYEAFQNVRIDENGDVILDNEALEALNQTLHYGQMELSSQNLADLQELIKVGVPGKAGEQTAKIVVDYYRYLGAENEFNTLYEQQDSPVDMSSDAYTRQYEELTALRALYLGQDVATSLFATADASARYMFDVQRVEADSTLTADEKAARLEEINNRLTDATVPVTNWRERYSTFLTEKQRLMDAGLDEQEKKVQLENLMHQHFDPDELAKVRYLQLDKF
ncbi:MAG TPA: lipase secretion chaperone [Marinobacter sp.]|nr:lipase secretion chaperone [Marinobacter sp.]